ncbi:MAG TPA: LytTR family DNA-binding domain-containing protein [Chitinophagaceae bacterium]|nr:LytTR family DNA-binding domain-containing protein [Chitinophagaceae bacterium]
MQTYFFVDTGSRLAQLRDCDIIFIEASRNYAIIETTTGRYTALVNLRHLETILPPGQFCRIHRSFIVSIAAIKAIAKGKIILEHRELPIGDIFRDELFKRITIASQTRQKNIGQFPDAWENHLISI